MTYVTIDLDWPTKLEIAKAWHRVKQHTNDGPYGRVSSGGCGVHIKSDATLPEPVPVSEPERIHAGDDMDRLEADRQFPNAPNQLLWDKKDGKRPGDWTVTLEVLIWRYEQSIDLTPTQHQAKHD
jgi:hypothetical protein